MATAMESAKLSDAIAQYIKNPTSVMILNETNIAEVPSICVMFREVKKLIANDNPMSAIKNIPPNTTYLEVKQCHLEMLVGIHLPDSIAEINATGNKIDKVVLQNPNLSSLILTGNPLRGALMFPTTITKLLLNGSTVSDIDSIKILSNLKIINISSTNIQNIDALPDSVLELYACRLNLPTISHLPTNLIKFSANSSNISAINIDKFPIGLTDLDLCDNNLTNVPLFPDDTTDIDLMKNDLTNIVLPVGVMRIDLRENLRLILTREQKEFLKEVQNKSPSHAVWIDDDDDYCNLDSDFPSNNLMSRVNDVDSIMDIYEKTLPVVPISPVIPIRQRIEMLHMLHMYDMYIPPKDPTRKIKHSGVYNV